MKETQNSVKLRETELPSAAGQSLPPSRGKKIPTMVAVGQLNCHCHVTKG